eukprot:31566_1
MCWLNFKIAKSSQRQLINRCTLVRSRSFHYGYLSCSMPSPKCQVSRLRNLTSHMKNRHCSTSPSAQSSKSSISSKEALSAIRSPKTKTKRKRHRSKKKSGRLFVSKPEIEIRKAKAKQKKHSVRVQSTSRLKAEVQDHKLLEAEALTEYEVRKKSVPDENEVEEFTKRLIENIPDGHLGRARRAISSYRKNCFSANRTREVARKPAKPSVGSDEPKPPIDDKQNSAKTAGLSCLGFGTSPRILKEFQAFNITESELCKNKGDLHRFLLEVDLKRLERLQRERDAKNYIVWQRDSDSGLPVINSAKQWRHPKSVVVVNELPLSARSSILAKQFQKALGDEGEVTGVELFRGNTVPLFNMKKHSSTSSPEKSSKNKSIFQKPPVLGFPSVYKAVVDSYSETGEIPPFLRETFAATSEWSRARSTSVRGLAPYSQWWRDWRVRLVERSVELMPRSRLLSTLCSMDMRPLCVSHRKWESRASLSSFYLEDDFSKAPIESLEMGFGGNAWMSFTCFVFTKPGPFTAPIELNGITFHAFTRRLLGARRIDVWRHRKTGVKVILRGIQYKDPETEVGEWSVEQTFWALETKKPVPTLQKPAISEQKWKEQNCTAFVHLSSSEDVQKFLSFGMRSLGIGVGDGIICRLSAPTGSLTLDSSRIGCQYNFGDIRAAFKELRKSLGASGKALSLPRMTSLRHGVLSLEFRNFNEAYEIRQAIADHGLNLKEFSIDQLTWAGFGDIRRAKRIKLWKDNNIFNPGAQAGNEGIKTPKQIPKKMPITPEVSQPVPITKLKLNGSTSSQESESRSDNFTHSGTPKRHLNGDSPPDLVSPEIIPDSERQSGSVFPDLPEPDSVFGELHEPESTFRDQLLPESTETTKCWSEILLEYEQSQGSQCMLSR